MNASQDETLVDSQEVPPPQTPIEKAQVDKEKEMAELLMTMDNYKAIVCTSLKCVCMCALICSLDTRCSD